MSEQYNYFSERDFLRANPVCKISDMEIDFLYKLDQARYHSGIPYIINSAHRTKEHELKKGRDGTSSHIKGIAVDIKATTSRDRFLILKGLLKAGFKRIGIGKDFIHVDDDKQKHSKLIWHYYE